LAFLAIRPALDNLWRRSKGQAMCGIVGLFLKDERLQPQLGALLTDMLVTMSDRGPDSAGLAVYRAGDAGQMKITVQSDQPDVDFDGLADALGAEVTRCDTHAIITVPE